MSNNLTNEDLFKNLLNFSPYGGLCQAFMVQGLQYYCQEVIERKEQMIKEEEQLMIDGKIPVMSMKTWVGIAEDISERIDMFFDDNNVNKLKY